MSDLAILRENNLSKDEVVAPLTSEEQKLCEEFDITNHIAMNEKDL